MKIAIFGRTIDESSKDSLVGFFERLKEKKGIEWYIYDSFYNYLISKEYIADKTDFFITKTFKSGEDLPKEVDLILSLGGDGTFLSTLPIIKDREIPVAGINFGRLGFLTSSNYASPWIDLLLEGNFEVQHRNLLTFEYSNTPDDFYPYALNEFSIQRDGPAVLELDIKINGESMPRYMADGVLIGSATGSTAYSMSAGGPIVMPECQVLTIVPVAPHNLNIRPLVVPQDSVIEISFNTRYDNATLSADNRFFKIPNGATIKISKAPISLKIVAPMMKFMSALNKKLFWGADWRNL